MKIIFVISALRNGGAERVLQILANGICDEFDVKIDTEDGLETVEDLVKYVDNQLAEK